MLCSTPSAVLKSRRVARADEQGAPRRVGGGGGVKSDKTGGREGGDVRAAVVAIGVPCYAMATVVCRV